MSNKRKIVILLLLFVIIHATLYILFLKLSDRKNERQLQLKNYKTIQNCNILFMGDSHTARGVDISEIDSSYSLAYYGENNMMNYYKLNYILENNYCIPKYIVMPCDIVTHTYGFNLARNNKSFYYSFIGLNEVKNLGDNWIASYFDYFKIKLFPYTDWQYAINKVNMDRDKKSIIKFSDMLVDKRKKAASFLIQDELIENDSKSNYFNKRALQYLERTIELCNKHHIKLIFVKFPLTNYIFDEIKYNVDSTYITHRPAEDIIHKNKIPILDFEYLYQNNAELFFDTHHLNADGKVKFTNVLKVQLDSLLKIY